MHPPKISTLGLNPTAVLLGDGPSGGGGQCRDEGSDPRNRLALVKGLGDGFFSYVRAV